MAPNLVRSLNSRLTYAYLVVGSKTMNELSTYNLGKLDKKKAVKSLLNMIALGLGWQNQMVPIKEMPWRSQYNNFLIMYRRVFITSWLLFFIGLPHDFLDLYYQETWCIGLGWQFGSIITPNLMHHMFWVSYRLL